jgi:glycosyltransferase involved in cell wall biosynthesis
MTAATVIIPTFNRPAQLATALRGLARQAPVPGGYEVLVVDDGSDPPLHQQALRDASGCDCRVLRTANSGPAAARNLASRQARGRILAFTDDDCAPDPDWLRGLLIRHEAVVAPRIVGGRTVNRLTANPFAVTSQNLITFGYDHYNRDTDRARFFASNNLSVPTAEFTLIGGFDERFRTAEDRDLCDRWVHSGRTMTYAPECVIHHAHAMGLTGFWRQHLAYGRGAYRFHAEHRRRNPDHRIVQWPYYRTLLASMLPPCGAHASPALIFALGVSQVANLLGFFLERSTPRPGFQIGSTPAGSGAAFTKIRRGADSK